MTNQQTAGPLLQIDDLHVRFRTPVGDVHALRGVSLKIERGEMFGLVGETGCGKSVTGLSVMGLLPAPGEVISGRILFDGQDLTIKTEAEMRRIRGDRMAMIFQDPAASLNPVFTVGQQLTQVIGQHLSLQARAIRERALRLLADVGLPDLDRLLDAYPHQLSGGMQQRVMIAIALSADPDLLIADEPTTALDVTIQAQILDLLVSLQRKRDIAVLLITHNLGVVAETCQRVAVLYAGRVAEQGSVNDLFHRPQHPYTQGLLAALPRPGSRGRALQAIPGNVPSGLNPLPGCAFAPRCPHVMDICQHEQPPLFRLQGVHRAACYLLVERSPGG